MHHYLITIVMHDGSKGRCKLTAESDWQAIDAVLLVFHDALSISPRRLP